MRLMYRRRPAGAMISQRDRSAFDGGDAIIGDELGLIHRLGKVDLGAFKFLSGGFCAFPLFRRDLAVIVDVNAFEEALGNFSGRVSRRRAFLVFGSFSRFWFHRNVARRRCR